MPTRPLRFIAQAGFDAARQLHALPSSHRASRPHGHGFVVQVRSALDAAPSPFAGGEVGWLQHALAQVVAPLDHSLLNEQVEEPSDERLARWIGARLGVPGAAVSVQSHPASGVDIDEAGAAWAWRRYRFQSAHRLPNVPLGHKCGRMHGHGFEAVVHVRVGEGQPSHLTTDWLDDLWAPLHFELNYACLNELPGLENPTSEMLSRWLWQRLSAGAGARLRAVKVYETASCGALYDGATHRIWKDFHLDSAVRLRHAPAGHPEARLHGHTYTLRLHLSAALDELRGWAVDFGDVKELFKPVFKALDHHALHDVPGLPDGDCASVAQWVLSQARERLPQVCRVDLFETEGCGAVAWASGSPEPMWA
ncbi:6-carboxytetrahydropterin synthase [Ideonella sp. DXS29W]|uniref:6-carboxy-5,6,7,8-tetrahydropterin synthase n=1 Tax=Ideonella lacteola TaxID=2984193 RepID=A0ABU9BS73_9BURK